MWPYKNQDQKKIKVNVYLLPNVFKTVKIHHPNLLLLSTVLSIIHGAISVHMVLAIYLTYGIEYHSLAVLLESIIVTLILQMRKPRFWELKCLLSHKRESHSLNLFALSMKSMMTIIILLIIMLS